MKNDRLLDIIGLADDKFIEEAAQKNKKNNTVWIKTVATAAACLCLVAGAFLISHNQNPTEDPNSDITKVENDGTVKPVEPPTPEPNPTIPNNNGENDLQLPIPNLSGSENNEPTEPEEPLAPIEPNNDIVRDELPDRGNPPEDYEFPEPNIIPGAEIPPELQPDEPPELVSPTITVNIESIADMGQDIYYLYDISELVNNNPWNEDLGTSLPVFKNPLKFDENNRVTNPELEKMKKLLLIEIAKKLNIDTDTMEIEDYTDGTNPEHNIEIFSETSDYEISVGADMTIKVILKNPIPIPEEYNLDLFATYDETVKLASYLKDTYLTDENIITNISGGDYDYDLRQKYQISFYLSANDIMDTITNYNFNRLKFLITEEGNAIEGFTLRNVNAPLLNDRNLILITPTITKEKAIEKLKSGDCYTTNPSEEFPGEEFIAKMEIVYNTDSSSNYYLPFYKFYVELPYDGEYHNGAAIKKYVSYYVFALKTDYKFNIVLGENK